MGKNVTVAQVMEIKKMADEKGVDREAFKRLYKEFSRVLDGANAPADIVSAVESGQTELWLHPDQTGNGKVVNGRKILAKLTDDDLLDSCVDFAQLKQLQAKGIDFWRKHFAGKVVVAWKSAQGGDVWYLHADDDKVIQFRGEIDGYFSDRCGALRFRK